MPQQLRYKSRFKRDPFNKYLTDNKKGAIVVGTVTEVEPKGVTVNLAEEVDGYIRVADIAVERVEDATEVAKVGDSIEAKFMGVDRKNRIRQSR